MLKSEKIEENEPEYFKEEVRKQGGIEALISTLNIEMNKLIKFILNNFTYYKYLLKYIIIIVTSNLIFYKLLQLFYRIIIEINKNFTS